MRSAPRGRPSRSGSGYPSTTPSRARARTAPRSVSDLVRRMLLPHLSRPLPELIQRSLECLVEALRVRAAFVARIDDGALEMVDAVSAEGPTIEIGLRIPLDDTFAGAGEDGAPVNV